MALQYAILAVLAHRDRTGYDLVSKMDGSVANFWPATHQQIYHELKKMNSLGLVKFKRKVQTEKPDKKVYSITRTGKRTLKTWIEEPVAVTQAKDPLLIKLFAGHLVSRETLLKELLRHKEYHRAKLDEYQRIEKAHFLDKAFPSNLLFQYLTLRKGIVYEEGWLKWYQECRVKYFRSKE